MDLTPRPRHGPEKWAELFTASHGQLATVIGDLQRTLERMAPPVIGAHTVALDANGNGTGQYRMPFRSLFIDSNSAHLLTVASSPLQTAAPGPGPGIGFVRPGGNAVFNFNATVWSVYGGTPGELVTVQAFARPQHAHSTAAGAGQGTTTLQNTTPAGGVTSPGAGASLASLTGLAAGLYLVQWSVSLGGTTGAGDANNMQVQVGSTAVAVANNRTSAGAIYPQLPVQVQVPASGTVSVNAIAAGTAGVVYDAALVLTLLR